MGPKDILNAERAVYLIRSFIDASINEQELEELEAWKRTSRDNQHLFEMLIKKENQQLALAKMKMGRTEEEALQYLKKKQKANEKLWPRLITAAAAIAVMVVGLWFFNRQGAMLVPDQEQMATITDVQPGSNRAILILGNGEQVNLSDAKTGITLNGETVAYDDGTAISEKLDKKSINGTDVQIITPKGGQYEVKLPDGTKVWLNAGSGLSYSTFLKERGRVRSVKLTGEAYFKVAKNPALPFIVSARGQEIKVLGTTFNVNSYADEPAVVTTLVEGAVEVNGQTRIKPGQQAISQNGTDKVSIADIATATAWRFGTMEFKDSDVQSIMRQLSRWYDIEVVYSNGIPDKLYNGTVERSDSLATVLKMLEITGLKFRMEESSKGKRLIVNQ